MSSFLPRNGSKRLHEVENAFAFEHIDFRHVGQFARCESAHARRDDDGLGAVLALVGAQNVGAVFLLFEALDFFAQANGRAELQALLGAGFNEVLAFTLGKPATS
jgi:hypothetical protein